MQRASPHYWSRIKVALYIALCMIAGRRSFIEFDGRTWSIIDD